jgi:hypothetical protein
MYGTNTYGQGPYSKPFTESTWEDAPVIEYTSPDTIKVQWSAHLFDEIADETRFLEQGKDFKPVEYKTFMVQYKVKDSNEWKGVNVKPDKKDEVFKAVSFPPLEYPR